MSNSTRYDISGVSVVNLRLTPEKSIVKGHIYDTTTGASVPNAYIRVSNADYSNSTRSNASGYYTVKTTAGHIKLDVSKWGYFLNGTEFDIVYGETKKIDRGLEAENARVSGYVFYNINDSGTGLGGVKVVVSGDDYYERSTFTDSSGYYEIYAVPGHLWLDVYPDIYMNSMELDIADGHALSVDIRLDASPIGAYRINYLSKTCSE